MTDVLPGAGRVALVTGAGRGIGKGIASRLAAEGYALGLTAEDSLQETEDLVRQEARRSFSAVADFTRPSAAIEFVEQAVSELGRVDVLVNNAGFTLTKAFTDTSEDELDAVFNVNFKAGYLAARTAVRHMRRQGGGSIINISSIHSRMGMPDHSAYAATKGAINAYTRELATELAEHGIRVNAILPGLVEVERYFQIPGYTSDKGAEMVPIGRPGKPADIAAMVAFLAHPEAGFVTGECIGVDGGSGVNMPIRL